MGEEKLSESGRFTLAQRMHILATSLSKLAEQLEPGVSGTTGEWICVCPCVCGPPDVDPSGPDWSTQDARPK